MSEVPIWQEPVRGGYPDFRFFGLPGLDQLRAFFKFRGPRPPISHLIGIWFDQVAEGTAVFSMPPTGWLLSPAGVIPGGVLAMLADAPLGCAVQTALPPGTAYTTSEISMTFLRPATTASGRISAHGQLIHAGRSLALSEVFIMDEQEQMLAHGTSRCYVFPTLDTIPEPPPDDFVPEIPSYDTPDPYEREVEGEILPEETWSEMSGLDLMKKWVAWELPAPPLYYLTGSRPTEADEGMATQVLPASRWLDSPLGRMQGGAEAFLAELAIQGAVLTTVPPGTAFAPLDLKINFFRPADSDGRDIEARAKVDHRGRTLATATCDLFNADGKRLASAVGTSMLLPGRSYSLAKPVVQTEEAADEDAVART